MHDRLLYTSTSALVRADIVKTFMLTSSIVSRMSLVSALYIDYIIKTTEQQSMSCICKPIHDLPSLDSVYPLLQEQVKEPSVVKYRHDHSCVYQFDIHQYLYICI